MRSTAYDTPGWARTTVYGQVVNRSQIEQKVFDQVFALFYKKIWPTNMVFENIKQRP